MQLRYTLIEDNFCNLSHNLPHQIKTNKGLVSGITNGKQKNIRRLYSTGRLTNSKKESLNVTPQLQEIIIGKSLGDLFIRKVPKGKNAFLVFEQGLKNEGYILHLYDLFKDYCSSAPKTRVQLDKRTNKEYSKIQFYTYSLPCFNFYHSLFYVNGVKTIPKNIGELLTPVGLAFWAMDDGNKSRNNFYLNTDSYSLSEIQLLIKVLKENFNLNCSYHVKRLGKYRIYIKIDSMDKFKSLPCGVTPHFHKSMMYKLTINSD
jgi:hypothetical protein